MKHAFIQRVRLASPPPAAPRGRRRPEQRRAGPAGGPSGPSSRPARPPWNSERPALEARLTHACMHACMGYGMTYHIIPWSCSAGCSAALHARDGLDGSTKSLQELSLLKELRVTSGGRRNMIQASLAFSEASKNVELSQVLMRTCVLSIARHRRRGGPTLLASARGTLTQHLRSLTGWCQA